MHLVHFYSVNDRDSEISLTNLCTHKHDKYKLVDKTNLLYKFSDFSTCMKLGTVKLKNLQSQILVYCFYETEMFMVHKLSQKQQRDIKLTILKLGTVNL